MIHRVPSLRESIEQAADELPGAHFIVLANDEEELHVLRRAGVESMHGTHTMFVDETVFRPLQTGTEFDAIYNARFSSFKRHYLCQGIERLALIRHSYPGMDNNESEVRALLPQAVILNEDLPDGSVKPLAPAEVAAAVNRSATGLCLSSVEGGMFASVEYLLCGTPVVSTHSQGGRERYLMAPYAELTGDDPEEVAQAVNRFKQKRLAKSEVRRYILTLLAFERRNFVTAVNLRVAALFGRGKEIYGNPPWTKANYWRPIDDWIVDLRSGLQ